ncbi:hypothetical protein [Mycobacterium timonense]|uniref:Head-to-tail stopper n=1 Tax=Mycobacterium timonense TaxID=701043 RepID=A0A7I9Z0B6_9MYCO|nr:hypothetical protein [Mycobacterium timonense]GFG94282.1 hypothetical protein MTIM_01610 [Mycobacterium timonense]
MNVTGGTTVKIYRSTKNRFGDKTNDKLIAAVPHCIHQPATGLNMAYHPNDDMAETTTLTCILWMPTGTDVRAKDRLKFNGATYAVLGTAWNTPHPVTGTVYSHFAVEITGVQ